MNHPAGKQLIADDRGRLWITSREQDRGGAVAYTLLRVETEFVDAFRHRYEATAAADVQP